MWGKALKLLTFGAIPHISATEVLEVIKRMKSGKATGFDDIASELWKAKSGGPILWLSEFLNRVIQEGRTSSDWQEAPQFQYGKRKVVQQNVQITDPIRLPPHTMNIFGSILDNRIRDIVQIAGIVNYGHNIRCAVTDGKKTCEKHRPLYIAFLDLEKAFDRVQHKLIWYAVRQQCQKNSSAGLNCFTPIRKVPIVAGISTPLDVFVGVHQGSALGRLLFALVMDTVMPYILLHVNYVFLTSHGKADVE